jgi:hypothetical protein
MPLSDPPSWPDGRDVAGQQRNAAKNSGPEAQRARTTLPKDDIARSAAQRWQSVSDLTAELEGFYKNGSASPFPEPAQRRSRLPILIAPAEKAGPEILHNFR